MSSHRPSISTLFLLPRLLLALLLLALLLLTLCGCGSGSDSGKIFVPSSGHPGDWANPLSVGRDTFHGTAAKTRYSGTSGGVLFLRHCAACHGEAASGKIGPNIQGASPARIDNAIKVVPLMKGHDILSTAQRGDIAGYLAIISVNTNRATVVIDTGVCMECHGANLHGGIAAISCYSCHNGPDGSIGHPQGWTESKDKSLIFHGNYAKTFVSSCANCHGFNLSGFIGPRCSLCHDGGSAPVLAPFNL